MKIKFSKTLAVILAIASITAMTGVTALADITSVVTSTTYIYDATDDPTVVVTSTVTAADAEGEVTYLVADKNSGIKFIDQKTLEAADNDVATAEFVFKAAQSALYDAELEVTAKFGTDVDGEFEMPTFKFLAGLDYFTNGDAKVEAVPVPPSFPGDFEVATDAKVIWGQLSGNGATEYGATITVDATEYALPAYGTVDGVFCVIVEADKPDAITATGLYVK